MKPSRQFSTALYFFVTSFVTLLYGIFVALRAPAKTISTHLYGQEVIVDKFELTIFFKIALLVLCIGYYVAAKLNMPLISALTLAHTVLTIGSILLCGVLSVILPDLLFKEVCLWLTVTALASQLLFVINFGYGMAKRKITAQNINHEAF